MAITLTVEDGTGLEDANSYVSRAEAIEFLEIEGASPEWDVLTESDKDLHLARATRLLDRYSHYTGTTQTNTQALAWPRMYAFDYSLPSECDRAIKSGHVPELLKEATAILADALASGEYSIKKAGEPEVSSLSLPDFSISLQGSKSVGSSLPLPLRIVEILKPLAYNAWGPRLT